MNYLLVVLVSGQLQIKAKFDTKWGCESASKILEVQRKDEGSRIVDTTYRIPTACIASDKEKVGEAEYQLRWNKVR